MGATSDLQHNRTWQPGRVKPSLLWMGLLAIPVVAILAFAIFQPIQVRPRMGLAPGFALVDQDGKRLTSEDLRGKLVLYNFTYANCTAPCPQTSDTMVAVQNALPELDTNGIPVELVTVSFDPQRDTPEQLRAYAQRLGADTEHWRFVTGDPTTLKNVIGGGFRVFYEPDGSGSFTFDPTLVLVDGAGIVRAEYNSAAPAVDNILRDLKLVVQEIEQSNGPGRLVYEAAHLFMCYPRQ